MNSKRIAGLVAVAVLSSGVGTVTLAQTNSAACDGNADFCLVDDYGTVFSLWRGAESVPDGVGSFYGYADVSPSIFPPEGLLCPVNGDFVVTGSQGNLEFVTMGIFSNCSCDESGTPAKRTALLTLDTNFQPAIVLEGNIMTAHSLRCDGSIEMFRGGQIGPAPTTTIFAPSSTPEFETLITP